MKAMVMGLMLCLAASVAAANTYSSPEDVYDVRYERTHDLCTAFTDNVNRSTGVRQGASGLMLDDEGVVFVYTNRDWEGLADREVTVALIFSNGTTLGGDAELGDGVLYVSPRADEVAALIAAWAYSRSLIIRTVKGVEYEFELNGTSRAWAALGACWQRHFRRASEDPFGDAQPSSARRTDPF